MRQFRILKWLLAPVLALLACLSTAQAEKAPLDALIRDPAFIDAAVSPDGKHLASVQRVEKDGPTYILVFETDDLSKSPVVFGAADRVKIRNVAWLDNENLVATMWQRWKNKRNPNTSQFAKLATISIEDKVWKDLPARRVDRRSKVSREFAQYNSGSLISIMPWDKENVLVAYNSDITRPPSIYKLEVKTGNLSLVARGDASGASTGMYGRDGQPRLKQYIDPNTDAAVIELRMNADSDWIEVDRNTADIDAVADIFNPVAQDEDRPNIFYIVSNHETDTAALYEYDLTTKKFGTMLFHHPKYDADGVRRVWRPELNKYEIVGYTYDGKAVETEYTSPREKALMDGIDAALPDANNHIISRSDDESIIIIRSDAPRTPPSYYMLKDKTNLAYLGSSNPELKASQLADVKWETYKARDGLEIPALITIPDGPGPHPVIIMPHGGPVARDYWGFDLWAQTLANEGYLVVQPQFRISTGFGKNHLKAGFKRWGYEMQDDLEDALQYVADKGYGDPDHAAIFGWSYGGYAAFVASERSPNVFQCAIAGAGVSDRARFRSYLAKIGDFGDKTYRKTADGYDPLANVDKVNIPIMVIHGEIDERVPIIHSELFVNELKKHNKEYEFLVLDGANHFFGTIFYDNWNEMFPQMFDFLEGPCGMKD
nr:prolyl oligopeptidase family serine peptidase [uncultured Hyphomonas sp.]